jgi:hypothetical protein
MRAIARRLMWLSEGSGGWSTGATTPRASPSWMTANCGPRSGPASLSTWSTRWPTVHHCQGRSASGTPAGRRTARLTTPTRIPHTDCDGHLAVVHNGIIENFAALCAEAAAGGHELASDTDTEVVAHLLECEMAAADSGGTRLPGPGALAEAMRRVCRRLEGAFTLVAVDVRDPGAVVGARRNSPLVIGRGDGENFLASDVAAFIAYTRRAVELGQDQVAEIRADGVNVTGFDGTAARVTEYRVDWDVSAAEKAGYEYFMLKEIVEQPRAIADTLLGRIGTDGLLTLDEMRLPADELREIDKIIVVACGKQSRPPRHSSPSSSAATWSRCTWPSCRGPNTATRSAM